MRKVSGRRAGPTPAFRVLGPGLLLELVPMPAPVACARRLYLAPAPCGFWAVSQKMGPDFAMGSGLLRGFPRV